MNASDVLVESLIEWGVEVVFGLPGDGINGVMEALRTHQDKYALSRCGTRRRQRSWPAAMRSTQAGWVFVLRHRDPEASTC